MEEPLLHLRWAAEPSGHTKPDAAWENPFRARRFRAEWVDSGDDVGNQRTSLPDDGPARQGEDRYARPTTQVEFEMPVAGSAAARRCLTASYGLTTCWKRASRMWTGSRSQQSNRSWDAKACTAGSRCGILLEWADRCCPGEQPPWRDLTNPVPTSSSV